MLPRRRSPADRARAGVLGVVPVLVLIGIAAALVLGGTTILLAVPPLPISPSPSPIAQSSGPSFPPIRSYAIVTDAPVLSPFPTAPLPAVPPSVTVKRLEEQDPAGAWQVSLAYPSFAEGTTPWAAEINAQFVDLVRNRADMFESGPGSIADPGKTNHLTSTFGTELLTPALVSLSMVWTEDTGGDLVTTIATFDFDMATGQPIAFDDLFTDPQGALSTLSAKSADLLYYQLGRGWDLTLGPLGTKPTHDNFANWLLTKSGLKIIFNPYQVANSPQTPAVIVPWSDLAPLLWTTGPVPELAGVSHPSAVPSADIPSQEPTAAEPSEPPAPTPQAGDTAAPSPSEPVVD